MTWEISLATSSSLYAIYECKIGQKAGLVGDTVTEDSHALDCKRKSGDIY